MNNKPQVLSSSVNKMQRRQRIASILELSEDGIVRLYKKRDNSLLLEIPASHLMYSYGNLVKSRFRLSVIANNKEAGVRLGVWSINAEKSTASLPKDHQNSTTKKTARDVWITTLAKYGAVENPKHPEEKIDKIGLWVLLGCLLTVIFMAATIALMR